MKFYGVEEQDRLVLDIEEVVREQIENGCDKFPIKVYEFKPMAIAKDESSLARDILEDIIERLDENFGDPDDFGTEATIKMKEASLEFAKVIMKEYKPWACERTGEVIEYTEEEARKIAPIE